MMKTTQCSILAKENERPLIAVLPLWDLERNSLWMLSEYMSAIQASGGTPLVLPFDISAHEAARFARLCDGFLFTGGQDVHPSVYGAQEIPGGLVTCPKRDYLETTVLQAALAADKPILGICRGLQLINAALGGSLYQDIPTEHPGPVHRQGKPYDVPFHTVTLEGSLADLLGQKTLPVNSLHHQAVKTLAPGLVPMAFSPDGLVEAFERPASRFLWAVQWHPEYLFKVDESSRMLFRHFMDSCEKS